VQRENALDALAVGDSAHGECFIKSATFAANHYASEYLDSFLVPFHNASMNAHAVADGKLRRVASLLFFLDGIDNMIHDNIPFPPAGRANIFIRISSKGKRKMGHKNWLVWKSGGSVATGPLETGITDAGYNISSSISICHLIVLICENQCNLWLIFGSTSAPVVQLDRATASGAVGCGFEPRRAHSLNQRQVMSD
jgi:hypothetical protein